MSANLASTGVGVLRARRKRFVGVDFSGGRNASRLIWIAEGQKSGGLLRVSGVSNASDRLLRGAREGSHAALAEFIAIQDSAVIAVDAPFSLPSKLMDRPWSLFVSEFAERFPAPEDFRYWCQSRSPNEIRRGTDIEARTPFCGWNLRLFRQTWAALGLVIGPLVRSDRARFAPMQPVRDDLPIVIEACPASTLKKAFRELSGKVPSYKGRAASLNDVRRQLLKMQMGGLRVDASSLTTIVNDQGGDALDALICMRVAACAEGLGLQPRAPDEAVEGRVYFEVESSSS